jgi:hypothetical protein
LYSYVTSMINTFSIQCEQLQLDICFGNQKLMSPPPIIAAHHSIILHLVVNDNRQTDITLAQIDEPENPHFMHI